jgi:hypothetical protein
MEHAKFFVEQFAIASRDTETHEQVDRKLA